MPLIRVSANLFGIILLAVLTGNSAYAAVKTPRQDRYCRAFFDEITKDTDEDLALLPYMMRALTGIYGTLNVPKVTDEKLIEMIVARDTRGLAFKIEGMGDALMAVDEVFFSQIHTKGKDLENLIGDYTFELELLEFIQKSPELSPLMTPNIEAMFNGRIAAARESLLRNMRREGWTGEKGKAYREIVGWLENAEPVTKKSYLKKKLLKWMAKEFEDLHAKIISKEIDPNDIEGGLHKMRRAIRKIAIVILSFDGMFYLDDSLKILGVELLEASTKTKFVPKEDDLLKRAVGISRDGFFYMGQLMGDFGRLKSGDGMKEYAYHALKGGKLGSEAKPLLAAVDPKGVSAPSFAKTRKEGAAIITHIGTSEFLLQMAKHFRAAAREF